MSETLKPFCKACRAIPAAGYCNLAGCPTAALEDARLRGREFFAIGADVMSASEGGAMAIAKALDPGIAEITAKRLGLRLDLVMGALRVAVSADELETAQAFARTAMDFLTGDHEPLDTPDAA